MDWGYSVCGFLIGGLIGLTGMGGGSLMTPLLILMFGLHPVAAVGTDLMYAAVTKSVGTYVHSKLGNVDWGIVSRLALGSVPATAVTIYGLSLAQKHGAMLDTIIAISLGTALILAAISLVLRDRFHATAEAIGLRRDLSRYTVLLGVVLGILVSISSIGAGALGVAVLVFLYPNLPAARIVGSDIAHAVTLTLLAGLGHWLIGSVDWPIVGLLLIGSLPGIWLGSHLSIRVSERVLFPVLAVVLLLIGGRLLRW